MTKGLDTPLSLKKTKYSCKFYEKIVTLNTMYPSKIEKWQVFKGTVKELLLFVLT